MGNKASSASTPTRYTAEQQAAVNEAHRRASSVVFMPRATFTDAELADPAFLAAADSFNQVGNPVRRLSAHDGPARFTNTTESRFSVVFTPRTGYTDADLADLARMPPATAPQNQAREGEPVRRFSDARESVSRYSVVYTPRGAYDV